MHKEWIKTGLFVGLMLSGGVVLAEAGPDQPFLEKALGVNQLELQLGKLAQERGSSPEVRAMGETMARRHAEMGSQLSALSTEAGGSPTAKLTAEQRATFARVASQSGSAFDAAFKETVDAGHVKELAMYRDEVSRTANPALRAFAEDRVNKLQASVAQAEAAKMKTKAKSKQDW
jgi:putative membrane protein